MLDTKTQINNWGWEDCSINKIELGYDNVIVEIVDSENTDRIYIICEDYIGFEFIGNWDESIIKNVEIKEQGFLIEKSIQKIKDNYKESIRIPGISKDLRGKWYQLCIELIDGISIEIACGNIKIENN